MVPPQGGLVFDPRFAPARVNVIERVKKFTALKGQVRTEIGINVFHGVFGIGMPSAASIASRADPLLGDAGDSSSFGRRGRYPPYFPK